MRGFASIDGEFRYRLVRDWSPEPARSPSGVVSLRQVRSVTWCMLNPSTADGTQDDPTVRKCIGFSTRWGFNRLVIVNLFAFRATAPTCLDGSMEQVGSRNDEHIIEAVREADMVVCAWGAHGKRFPSRVLEVRELVDESAARGDQFGRQPAVGCLGLTADGQPRHPLMLGYGTPRQVFPPLGGVA